MEIWKINYFKNFKKGAIALFATIIVSIVSMENSYASNQVEYYLVNEYLNVRAGAGTRYDIVFVLQRGDEVELLSKRGSWYHIKHLERTGYVSSRFLSHSRTVQTHNFNTSSESSKETSSELVLIIVIFGIFIGFLFIRRVLVRGSNRKKNSYYRQPDRGTWSELALQEKLLELGYKRESIFHDLYIEKQDGTFGQIDNLFITEVGILVFEVKEYGGWIYGNGNQAQWTQVMAYGKNKYRFQNPIRQNNSKIRELRRLFGNIPFFSIVVFYGECTLKEINFVPDKVYVVKWNRIKEVVDTIIRTEPLFHYHDFDRIINTLKIAQEKGACKEIQSQHIENINDMLGKKRIFD